MALITSSIVASVFAMSIEAFITRAFVIVQITPDKPNKSTPTSHIIKPSSHGERAGTGEPSPFKRLLN